MNHNHSTPYCPACDHHIQKEELNITEGVALCAECGLISRLSDLNFLKNKPSNSLNKTPRKIKITSNRRTLKIKISLFSFIHLLGSLFATLFWNGIVSLFLCLAVAAVCFNTIGYVPDWLPVLGLEDGKPIMNDKVMGPGMTIFICLFLTPFVAIGLYLLNHTLLRLCGSTTITLDRNQSSVSTGIWFLRLKKSFHPKEIKSIKIALSKSSNENESYLIEMTTKAYKKINFGRLLNDSQQEWLVTTLKQIIIHKRPSNSNLEIKPLDWLK